MTIVALEKMTLYGAESQKESVIDQLQKLGCAHLVDLAMGEEDLTSSDSLKDAREALKYLHACPEQRRQVVRKAAFDRGRIVTEVLALQDQANELSDERDELITAETNLEPWGEFRLSADRSIGDVKVWFFEVSVRDLKQPVFKDVLWQEISRDIRSVRIVILSLEMPTHIPGHMCQLDPRPLSEIRDRMEVIEDQLEELHHQRAGLTRWSKLLKGALDEADDAAAREQAMLQTLDGQSVFAIQGWIPCESVQPIQQFAEQNQLALTIEPPSPDDDPPTLLHHDERVAGSEDLVTFYKTPVYKSWDPSIVAYVSFAVFFAMIIADAGYGIVLAVLTAYLWKRMGKTRRGCRGRNVLATLVAFTIVYGVICGSYFGITPSPHSTLGRLKFLDAESQSMMMPISILIGVIHLSLANLAIAWLRRGRTTALAPLGWVAVMLGASVAAVGVFYEVSDSLGASLTKIGASLLIGGLLAVFLFTSSRPIFSLSIKNHGLRVLEGLQGLAGFSGLFGDVLSYLRLFALGLSSAKLSQTFNALGADAWDSAGFGVLLAIAIVILGHTLNLVLCIMSGVVHGLRLNCIEFFKWALPEEGYLFKAFAKKVGET